ncbi:MAG: hypothetical protein OWS74_08380 [Firmicutes bacterium]|nr:hypothetical protein [Bacillota bacterium]
MKTWLIKQKVRGLAWWQAQDGNVFIENGIWIILVVLAMILPIEALRNAIINAFESITKSLTTIQ